MSDPAFAQLASHLTEAFGQQMGSSRVVPEGILLQTTDGFLYAYIADPTNLSLATVQRFIGEAPGGPRHLVLFCPERLPLALSSELIGAGATVVEGSRFLELVHSLDLDSLVGAEPRPARAGSGRLLPSARVLDALMGRGRSWLEWGVPALALRFYRQAAELKPGFIPARTGVGHALLALGILPEARAAFSDVLQGEPTNVDARIGLAAVLGAEGHPEAEVEAYRAMLADQPELLAVRAHLVAALAEHGHWGAARTELATMLESVPDDGRLRYLHSVALERTGASHEAEEERDRARKLGLTPEQERSLRDQLHLPPARGAPPPAALPAAVLIARTRPAPPDAATAPTEPPTGGPPRPARTPAAPTRKRTKARRSLPTPTSRRTRRAPGRKGK
jgi:tetratricopeptide (TPR) repeat protein